MTQAADLAAGRTQRYQWKIFTANYLGLIFEAYDLTIYSLLVVAVTTYFDVPPWYAFLVLTLTYVLRSVGGLVFGNIADRIGRRNTLVITVLGYSLATGLTGLSWSITSLIFFRALTGLFVGGEYVAYAYTMEVMPRAKRGYFSGAIVTSYSVGFLIASGTFAIISAIMGENFAMGGGWRWPFFVGIIPALIALYLRLGVEESPAWSADVEQRKVRVGISLARIFTPPYLLATIVSWLIMAGIIWAYDVMLLALPTMFSNIGVPGDLIGVYMILANVGSILGAVVGGIAAQRLGPAKALIATSVLGIVCVPFLVPFWMLPGTPTVTYIIPAVLVGGIAAEAGFGLAPLLLARNYTTELRGAGTAGVYNLGQIIAGWSLTIMAVTFGEGTGSWMYGMAINAVVAFLVVIALAVVTMRAVRPSPGWD